MNVKDFLIGACTAIVGAALGATICCFCCNNNCDKKCDKPDGPCPIEQQHNGPKCQDAPKDCHKGDKKDCYFEKFAQELGLSEEQMTQIKALKEQQKSAMKAAKETFDNSLQSILTDEQKAKFAEIKEFTKERRHCGGKQHKEPKPDEE